MGDLVDSGAPWWVLIVLLLLGVGVPAAGTERAADLPGILGTFGRWWQGRRARRRAELVEMSESELIANEEIKRLKEFYTRLAADCRETAREASERADKQDELIEELREDVQTLQGRITASERRFYLLLGHHRRVVDSHEQHAPGVDLPVVPEELADYL